MAIHREIIQLIYYTKGGFTWEELYFKVPIYLRRFYIREVQSILDEEAKGAREASNGGNSRTVSGVPNYGTVFVPD